MICIKNLRNEKIREVWDFRVDRGSVVGNKFYMKDESMRDEVCEKYEVYFKYMIDNNLEFRKYVYKMIEVYRKYGKLNLFCWCAPKRCHAETIRKYIEEKA